MASEFVSQFLIPASLGGIGGLTRGFIGLLKALSLRRRILWNYYAITGNYSWNVLNKQDSLDPLIPAFNTPQHKFNIGLNGRDMVIKLGSHSLRNLGFNINYKWIQGFEFEGSPQFTGFIPTYSLLDAQVNYMSKRINLTVKGGASNILNNMQYQTYGGPYIGRMGYVSLVYELK